MNFCDDFREFPFKKFKLFLSIQFFQLKKYFLSERTDVNQQKSLMDELKILIHLGHHANIVNLMGAVTKSIQKGNIV